MAKPALGRGLGNLLQGTKPSPAVEELRAKPASLSPGMATLLKGNGADPSVPLSPRQAPDSLATRVTTNEPGSTWHRLAQGSLVLTDLLLVGMAAWLTCQTHAPLGAGGTLLCVLAFLLGAWATCLALMRPRK